MSHVTHMTESHRTPEIFNNTVASTGATNQKTKKPKKRFHTQILGGKKENIEMRFPTK